MREEKEKEDKKERKEKKDNKGLFYQIKATQKKRFRKLNLFKEFFSSVFYSVIYVIRSFLKMYI